MDYSEILSYDICPNCWSNNFIIEKRICLDCWYSLQHDNIDYTNNYLKSIKNDLQENIEQSQKLKEKKFKVNYKNFESYKIGISSENKIEYIKFFTNNDIFWKKTFLIKINYEIISKDIDEIEFYETEKEERFHHYHIDKINITLPKFIFEKAKVWYKEKKPVWYYKQINKQDLKMFIERIIKSYHKLLN